MAPINRTQTPAPRGMERAAQDVGRLSDHPSTYRTRSQTPAPSSSRTVAAPLPRSATPGPNVSREPTPRMSHIRAMMRQAFSDDEVFDSDFSFGSATVVPETPPAGLLPPRLSVPQPVQLGSSAWSTANTLPYDLSLDPLPSPPPVPSLPTALVHARPPTHLSSTTSIWDRAGKALRRGGIVLPADNFWRNWPTEQRDSLPEHGSVVRSHRTILGNQLEPVFIKAVKRRSEEYVALQKLTSPELRHLSKLACPPILEFINCYDVDDYVFVVMPPLVPLKLDDLTTIGDVFDFVHQLLEAVHFLHSQLISHGDIQIHNIMVLPPSYSSGGARRRFPSTVNYSYCLIDYSYSHRYKPREARLTFDREGPAEVPPEVGVHRKCGGHIGYDPFPVDIWMVGRILLYNLIYAKANLRMLLRLAHNMAGDHLPFERPDSKECLDQFRRMAQKYKTPDFLKSAARFPDPSRIHVGRNR